MSSSNHTFFRLILSLVLCIQLFPEMYALNFGKENNTGITSVSPLPGEKAAGKEVILYITRHGKTLFNSLERSQGWSDTPLTKEGIEVAECLGRGLRDTVFVSVYTSDSGRARETAEIVMRNNRHAFGVPCHETTNLREWFFGSFEGKPVSEVFEACDKVSKAGNNKAFFELSIPEMADCTGKADPEGLAESWPEIEERVGQALRRIASEAELTGGGNVLLVCHGFTISSILQIVDKEKVTAGFKNASITKLIYKEGKFAVVSVNDMQYVENGKRK